MTDEKREPWLNYLALTTVVLAVCATLSTFKGGSYSTRSVLSQSQAADQWAFYQAKSIKGYLYEIQTDEVETQLKVNAARWPAETVALYRGLAAEYGARVARYEAERAQIQQEANRLEERRDHAQRHSQTFGMAVIFLQIAILLSSISALLRKKPLWALGAAVGLVGVYYFITGFFAGAL
jgi:hypothetical protein